MTNKHTAHLTPLPFDIRTWLWWYIYLLLLISKLWHRQAIFESKGDRLSSSAETRILIKRVSDTFSNRKGTSCVCLLKAGFQTRGSQTPIRQQTECLLTNRLSYPVSSLKTWTRQASDFRIERREVVFLYWILDSNPESLRHLFASRRNACWQTDWAFENQA